MKKWGGRFGLTGIWNFRQKITLEENMIRLEVPAAPCIPAGSFMMLPFPLGLHVAWNLYLDFTPPAKRAACWG
jgi:hypothetical protein